MSQNSETKDSLGTKSLQDGKCGAVTLFLKSLAYKPD